MKLDGKAALVTGGSRGIGAAIARRLAADGAAVGIVYKANNAAAERVAEDVRATGARAEIFHADVSDEREVEAMVQAFAARFGKVDILVNSAGVFEVAPVGEIPRSMFANEMFTNAWSVVASTQAALPFFPADGGYIVNVSTDLVHVPGGGSAVYSASKAAVEVLTRGFAMELGPRGIRVNAVPPAITRTDMTAGIPASHLEAETALTRSAVSRSPRTSQTWLRSWHRAMPAGSPGARSSRMADAFSRRIRQAGAARPRR